MDNYSVYVHIFPNGKQYVGMTTNPTKRWRGGKGYIDHPLMHKEIELYGWDNIKHVVLRDNLSKEEAAKLERIETINRKSYLPERGFNISIGNSRPGDRNPMYGKSGLLSPVATAVYQYEKPSGIFLNSYGSALEAATANNIENHIRECCNGDRISCGGFYWSFEKRKRYIPRKKISNNYHHSPVLQFDRNMNLLCKFSSIREAEEALKISNIGRACTQTYRTAGGFKWRYADDYS